MKVTDVFALDCAAARSKDGNAGAGIVSALAAAYAPALKRTRTSVCDAALLPPEPKAIGRMLLLKLYDADAAPAYSIGKGSAVSGFLGGAVRIRGTRAAAAAQTVRSFLSGAAGRNFRVSAKPAAASGSDALLRFVLYYFDEADVDRTVMGLSAVLGETDRLLGTDSAVTVADAGPPVRNDLFLYDRLVGRLDAGPHPARFTATCCQARFARCAAGIYIEFRGPCGDAARAIAAAAPALTAFITEEGNG
ncbi:MAG: hypothetical protein LBH24_00630 [Clostridiales bacterium]|jgi:hypothetical protein|nr:hypothetical protein [Clostridiales bacterium]